MKEIRSKLADQTKTTSTGTHLISTHPQDREVGHLLSNIKRKINGEEYR